MGPPVDKVWPYSQVILAPQDASVLLSSCSDPSKVLVLIILARQIPRLRVFSDGVVIVGSILMALGMAEVWE